MDNGFNLPHIMKEGGTPKHCRMVVVIVIIIIMAIVFMNYSNNPDVCFTDVEHMQDDPVRKIYSSDPITGQYIILTNLTKNRIPINKIVVTTENRNMINIPISHAIIKPTGKNGMSIMFKLPKEESITQVIIDMKKFCTYKKNITTTQMEIKNKNNKTVWKYNESLPSDKDYIYVYIRTPKIDYSVRPSPSQQLCNGSANTEYDQENILNNSLQHGGE